MFDEIYKNWLQLNVCDNTPISTLRYIYLIKHKTKGFYFIVHGAFTPYLYYCCEKS